MRTVCIQASQNAHMNRFLRSDASTIDDVAAKFYSELKSRASFGPSAPFSVTY